MALIGHIHGVQDLIDDKVEGIRDGWHLALVVLHIVGLRLLHQGLHAGFRQELDEGLILGKSLVAAVEKQAAVLLIACGDEFLGLVEGGVYKGPLLVVEALHIGPILHELFIAGSLLHRTGDDEGGTGVVDENGVNLVHDGIVVLPLD